MCKIVRSLKTEKVISLPIFFTALGIITHQTIDWRVIKGLQKNKVFRAMSSLNASLLSGEFHFKESIEK